VGAQWGLSGAEFIFKDQLINSRMRSLLIVLCFLMLAPNLWGQGFGRILGEEFAMSIEELHFLGDGKFRLKFNYTRSGSGPGGGFDSYAIYNPELDSLGLEQRAESWSTGLHNINSMRLELSAQEFFLSRQGCCAEGSRQGMAIKHLNLSRNYRLPEKYLLYQVGNFDPLLIGDSIFILRSLDSVDSLLERDYRDNSEKILSYYDLDSDSLMPLDTIDFGVDFISPGSLFYHSENREFELLYDSLQFFFKRGARAPARTEIHYGSFWHGGRAQSIWSYGQIVPYYANLHRHYLLKADSCWYVADTLGYSEVKFCVNRYGELSMTYWEPRPESPLEDYELNLNKEQDNGISAYYGFNKENGAIYLMRLENGEPVHTTFLSSNPYNMFLRDIYSLADGSFYIVGAVPYDISNWDPYFNSYKEPIFVKVGPKGSFHEDKDQPSIPIFIYRQNQLKAYLEQPYLHYKYRIISPAGQIEEEGQFRGTQLIDISGLNQGLHILQLWYLENGAYVGQGKFIKPYR